MQQPTTRDGGSWRDGRLCAGALTGNDIGAAESLSGGADLQPELCRLSDDLKPVRKDFAFPSCSVQQDLLDPAVLDTNEEVHAPELSVQRLLPSSTD